MDSKLNNGKIPSHTVCPFRDRCPMAENGTCKHHGTEHRTAFSCGAARAYDLIERIEVQHKQHEHVEG